MAEALTSARVTLEPVAEETPLPGPSGLSDALNCGTMNKIPLLPPSEMSKSLDGYLEPFVKQRLGPLQGTFEGLNGIDFAKRRLDIQLILEQYHRALAEHHALGGKPRLSSG
ncbi:hypothetical protein CEP54_006354 [Fusarium duplospermum]|uniref:Uncharacterized protein n=1 Tax=Fusarium duplospermum TaxID=1325734 RepID=A0A428Q7A5_9HYPO|nr:hypothetical protein CEP54_006354 [Fusarium duplospermum]